MALIGSTIRLGPFLYQKGENTMSYALATHLRPGVWSVRCVQCGRDLGTMDGKTLEKAMLWAVGKGGVKCPKCRAHSCVKCGGVLKTGETIAHNGLCWFCQQDNHPSIIHLKETTQL